MGEVRGTVAQVILAAESTSSQATSGTGLPHIVGKAGPIQPYISAWALWSRICDINALGRKDARELLRDTVPTRSVLRASLREEWIQARLTLQTGRSPLCTGLEGRTAGLTLNHLRYCATCLADGYHSLLFQHIAMSHCPVHGESLRDRCRSCTSFVSTSYEQARAVPFGCPACGQHLAQWPVARQDPTDYRLSIGASIAAILSSTTNAARLLAGTARAREEGHPEYHWWADPDPFVTVSRWRRRSQTFPRTSSLAEVHQRAWSTLLDFLVEARPTAPLAEVLACAARMENRATVLGSPQSGKETTWLLAALVAGYGAAKEVERARRLRATGKPAEYYALSPQQSAIVAESAQANATIFRCELDCQYRSLVRRLRREGHAALVDMDAKQSWLVRTPWASADLQADSIKLFWRVRTANVDPVRRASSRERTRSLTAIT